MEVIGTGRTWQRARSRRHAWEITEFPEVGAVLLSLVCGPAALAVHEGLAGTAEL